MFVLVIKWRDSGNHLVGENTEGPPVKRVVVPRTHDHLGRQVLRGAAEGVGLVLVRLDDLGEAEVGQLDIPVTVE